MPRRHGFLVIVESGRYAYVRRNQAAALFEDRCRLLWRGSMLECIPSGLIPLEAELELSVKINEMLLRR